MILGIHSATKPSDAKRHREPKAAPSRCAAFRGCPDGSRFRNVAI